MRPHEVYVCAECDEVFKAVGVNMRCPACMSSAFTPVSVLLNPISVRTINERTLAFKVSRDGKTCVDLVKRPA